MTDFFPIRGFDHVEFYVGNAHQAAMFYSKCFGFTRVARQSLETGSRDLASHVLQQGDIRLVLTTALHPDHPVARQVLEHGDGVGVIGLAVPDAERAHKEATSRGAKSAYGLREVEDSEGIFRRSAIHAYGDTLIEFVDRQDYRGAFAPGFEAVNGGVENGHGVGLKLVDHIVGNVALGDMNRWVDFFSRTMGFSQLMHFDDEAISTEYSALMSKVMQDGSGKIKFPINEPAEGRRKSQIEEYLEYNHGPGVQHVAWTTDDIVATVRGLRANGIEFLHVPPSYYDDLEARVGAIAEPMDKLAELGILVDRDEDGYLLQIFTRPVEDRPTVFFEIIERHGAKGFGEGNFKSLFEAIERDQALRGNL